MRKWRRERARSRHCGKLKDRRKKGCGVIEQFSASYVSAERRAKCSQLYVAPFENAT